jgi:NhaP-type Na+/H+ or K+/H+ antiporter
VEPPPKDPVAIGLGALGSGLGLGGGVLTFSLVLVRAVQHANISTRATDAVVDTSTDILVGLFAGIAVAAFFGWRRSRGVENIFQRGAIAAIAAFGAVMIGFLIAPIVDRVAGLVGLAIAGILLIAGGVWSGIWACRAGGW